MLFGSKCKVREKHIKHIIVNFTLIFFFLIFLKDLMLDFALVIVFLRIYIRTYLYIKNQDSSQFPEGNDPQEEFNSNTKFSKFTNQIILLPIAAFVHMFGTIATLFVHPTG